MARPINYLTTEEQILFPQATKRFGFSNLFGKIFFGFARFGEENSYAGIYRHTSYYGKRTWQKILMNWPTNPQTVPQQAWRSVFTDAITAWHGLTSDQKIAWKVKGMRKRLPGYNMFISSYLQSHRL